MSGPSPQQTSSLSFAKAVEKFSGSLPPKQKADFANTSLEDLHETIQRIQQQRGRENKLRNMARIQSFLKAMDQFRKVIEQFQNCTPFLGFVWGSMKFVLLVADTWVRSFDIILGAYKEIGERLPSFIKYRTLFENDLEIRKALELYFCDILEFHFHAMKFLNRPKWKELFESSWKTFDTQFKRILDSLARHKTLIESEKGTLTFLEAQKAREIAETQAKEAAHREEVEKFKVLMERLAPTDFSRDQYEASQQRQLGNSGKWLLQSEEFKRWFEMDVDCNPLLYINGIPGSGKTVLSSFLIETLLKEGRAPVLYFFCKHNRPGKNRYIDILSALIAQFVQQHKALTGYFHDICITKDRLGILEVLETLAETAFQSHTEFFVLIDGLDECYTDEAEKIISWLISQQEATESASPRRIRLLFAGQRTSTLTRLLAPAVSISLDVPEHHADVRHYVENLAIEIQEGFGLDDFVRSQIVSKVTGVAKSMFLYARLVMDNLQNQVTQKELLRELEPAIFPVDLDNAYQRICETVFKERPQRKAVLKIIGHIVCAARSLKWREVQAVFYIDPKQNTSDYAGCRLRKDCKQLCGSLVDLRKDKDDPDSEAVLELVHETAQDYLIRKGLIDVSLCHFELTKFCLDYLLSSCLALSAHDEEIKQQAQDGYYAFHDYASIHWFDHLSILAKGCDIKNDDWWADLASRCGSFLESFDISNRAKFSSKVASVGQIKIFIDSIPTRSRDRNVHYDVGWRTVRIRSAVEGLYDRHQNGDKAQQLALNMYGIRPFKCRHVDCYYYFDGFSTRVARDHHNDRHDRPYKCIQSECPFQGLGFETPSGLETHIKANHSATEDDSPTFPAPAKKQHGDLCEAAARGDLVAVTNLLDQGSNINQTSRKLGGFTPLISATRNSHIKVVKLLLQHGADVNFQGPAASTQTTAFHFAVENNTIEILQELMATQNVDPDKKDKGGLTPLLIACRNGSTAAVKLLLDSKKVNVLYQSSHGNALSISPWSNDLMELLMSQISTTSAQDMLFGSYFVRDMDTKFFRLVLPHLKDRDWDVRIHRNEYTWPLMIRSQAWEMAKFLVNSGKFDRTALNHLTKIDINDTVETQVTRQRREALFKDILEHHKVNLDCVDSYRNTPLYNAAAAGLTGIVKLLLETGKVNFDNVNDGGYTPLGIAAARGQSGVVKLLLETGKVNVNHANNIGDTPLSAAIDNNHTKIIDLLLTSGMVDIMDRDNMGETFISRSIQKRRVRQVEWLLEASLADPNTGKAVIEVPSDEVESLETFIKDPQKHQSVLSDYPMQLLLLEQMNKKRLLMARQEQDTIIQRSS